MRDAIFKGSGVALSTPFTDDGVDYQELFRLIDFQIENKTQAVIICGTTGEASTMPDDEHKQVMKAAVEYAKGKVKVICGTGSNDTKHCVELSEYAEQVGADGVLVVTPYYNKTTPKGLVLHYRAVARAVNIPVILYNVPSRTGMSISPAVLKELSLEPNIVAIKEASGDIALGAKMIAQCPDIALYSGNDDCIVPLMSLGGVGVISTMGNIIPRQVADMTQACLAGDFKKAAQLQLEYMDLIEVLFCEVNPIPVKTALNLMGYKCGKARPPLCEMEESNLKRLVEVLKKHQLV